MNNRIRKKIYKRYLNNIIGDVSQSSVWRQKLFVADYFSWHRIDYDSLIGIPVFEKEALRRYKLSYEVSKILPTKETEKLQLEFGEKYSFDKCKTIFLFRASEYQEIYSYSWNNVEHM